MKNPFRGFLEKELRDKRALCFCLFFFLFLTSHTRRHTVKKWPFFSDVIHIQSTCLMTSQFINRQAVPVFLFCRLVLSKNGHIKQCKYMIIIIRQVINRKNNNNVGGYNCEDDQTDGTLGYYAFFLTLFFLRHLPHFSPFIIFLGGTNTNRKFFVFLFFSPVTVCLYQRQLKRQ